MGQGQRPVRRWARDLAAASLAALAGGGLSFALATPENLVWPHPWHHDDYNLLGLAGTHAGFGTVRPVAGEVSALLATLGPMWVYAALAALVALSIALTVSWAGAVLDAPRERSPHAAIAFGVGAALFLFEWSPWTVRYLGHLTNALSAALGLGAALLALRVGARGPGRALGPGGAAAMLVLYALAGLAKEDFLLLPIASLAPGALASWRARDRRGLTACAVALAAFAALAVAIVVYNVRAGSPFLFGAGTYAVHLAPAALLDTAGAYLVCSRYARNLLVALALASIASLALRLARPAAWVALWAGVLALIAPYAPLGDHRYPLYAYNWIPLMLAGVGWTLAEAKRRFPGWPAGAAIAALAVALAISLHGIARRERHEQAAAIARAQAWSRDGLARAAAVLRGRTDAAYAVVVGADERPYGPWFASTGVYLNRAIGADLRWIVLQRPDSFGRKLIDEQRWPHDWGRIVFVDVDCLTSLRALGLPIVRLGDEPLPDAAEPRIAASAAPAETTAGGAPSASACGLRAVDGASGGGAGRPLS